MWCPDCGCKATMTTGGVRCPTCHWRGSFGPLREVTDDTDNPQVVSLRNDLAQWFRDFADQAERGEIRCAAVALVLTDERYNSYTEWHDATGNGPTLLGAVAVLQHRIASRLGGES